MKNLCYALSLLSISAAPNIANAIGMSWERNINNIASASYTVSVVAGGKGHFYIKCPNDHEYEQDPYDKMIGSGQLCKTKMTTSNSIHATAIIFNPPTYLHYPSKMFNVVGNATNPSNAFIQFRTGHASPLPVYAGNGGGVWFNVQNIEDPSPGYNGGSLPIKKEDGSALIFSNAPLTTGITVNNESGQIPPTARSSTIYNFVSEPITLDLGSVSGGQIKLIHGTPEVGPDDISVKPESSNTIEFSTEYKPFTIQKAVIDQAPDKGNWVPGVVNIEHSYHPEQHETLHGTYWFHDATTNKVVDRHITNFSINTDQGGKFDYPIKTHDGKIQMIRVLLNAAPFDNTIAQSEGSMVICPVGFKEIVGCE